MLFSRSRNLIYKMFNPAGFCVVLNTFKQNLRVFNTPIRVLKLSSSSVSGLCRYNNFVKLFSSSSSVSIIKEFKTVLPYSKKLCIDVQCNLKVKHKDSQSVDDVDCLIARVFGLENCNFSVEFVESERNFTLFGRLNPSTNPEELKSISLEIEMPINYDMNILCEWGNVYISNLISDYVSVQVKNGNISCKNLYCASMSLMCFNGNVNCEGILQGNIDIKTMRNGNIKGFNFQGGYLKAETENGDISVSSTYSDKSIFLTAKGNLILKNLHRRSSVIVQQGNLFISGLDGSLDARVEEGNIKVQVSQLNGDSYIETKKGNIILSVAKDDLCQLNLSAKSISIKDKLDITGEIKQSSNCEVFRSFPSNSLTHSTMKVISENGEVHLEKESWVSTLKLGAK